MMNMLIAPSAANNIGPALEIWEQIAYINASFKRRHRRSKLGWRSNVWIEATL